MNTSCFESALRPCAFRAIGMLLLRSIPVICTILLGANLQGSERKQDPQPVRASSMNPCDRAPVLPAHFVWMASEPDVAAFDQRGRELGSREAADPWAAKGVHCPARL